MAVTFPDFSTTPGTPGLEVSDFAARRAVSETDAATGRRAELTSCLLPAREFGAIAAAQWDALSNNALVENPFYSRTFIRGGLGTIDTGSGIAAFAVWSRKGHLVGFFPMRSLFGTGYGAQNIYQFNGAPLVHRDNAEDVILKWLLAIRDGPLPGCWQLPDLQLNGPLHDLICQTAPRLGLSLAVVNTYSRPQLTRLEGGFEAHLSQALGKSRRKELERCLRRLREKGVLRLERATAPDAIRSALEAFLALENAGWKGRAGTSFLARGEDASFARAAFSSDGTAHATIIDTLLLDDRPIAINVNIASGSTLFSPKTAYCEDLRSFAPGLVLEYLVIERFYSEPDFVCMDAATTVDGHVLQGLWNETVPVGTLYVGSATKTGRAVYLARVKSGLKPYAKWLRDYLRSAGRAAETRRMSKKNR